MPCLPCIPCKPVSPLLPEVTNDTIISSAFVNGVTAEAAETAISIVHQGVGTPAVGDKSLTDANIN